MQYELDLPAAKTPGAIDRYLHLTRVVMPDMARSSHAHWPVCHDHCFQRIVLDNTCGGVWYDHIRRPARRHLDPERALRAVRLCDDIIAGRADLAALNRKSLAWRRPCKARP